MLQGLSLVWSVFDIMMTTQTDIIEGGCLTLSAFRASGILCLSLMQMICKVLARYRATV